MNGEIRVERASVLAYGREAQETFESIRRTLEQLVRDAIDVKYYGPNAVDFKTKCGQLGADLANALTTDMGQISDAVREATSAISESLGGSIVAIEFNGSTITPDAVPAGDGAVGASIPELTSFKSAVSRHFSTIAEAFTAHLGSLERTDWSGNAKERAVGTVRDFTSKARAKVEETSAEMIGVIDSQIDALRAADGAS